MKVKDVLQTLDLILTCKQQLFMADVENGVNIEHDIAQQLISLLDEYETLITNMEVHK